MCGEGSCEAGRRKGGAKTDILDIPIDGYNRTSETTLSNTSVEPFLKVPEI